jgi:hypothetical protein
MSLQRRSSQNIVVRVVTSYIGDLRNWVSSLGTRYTMAAGLMTVGAASLTVAAGIGVAAGFHALEMRYGTWTAYAVVGGIFAVIGIAALLAGRMVLNRPAAPVPSPQRQMKALKGSVVSALGASLALRKQPAQGDPVTRVLAAGAAATLIGWVAITYLQQRSGAERD